MHRTSLSALPSPTRRLARTGRSLAVVVLLAAVVTAAAPSFIRIEPGDTLSGLAQRHGTSVQVLRELNDLPGNGVIYAGSRLRLPDGSGGSGGSGGSSGERGYTVQVGDTLSEIAQRYGTSVRSLRDRNQLSGPLLAGRRLAVAGGSGSGSGSGSSSGSGSGSSSSAVQVPSSVTTSAAESRARLRQMSVPGKTTVRRMVAATARRHGVSPSLAVSVAYHESGFQQRVVSGVNAIGVMQVLPSTGRVLGQQHGRRLDLLDAQDNITAGVLLLRQLGRSTGSESATLAGYYQGLGSISRKGLLPQTHAYIRSIGYLRQRFANG